MNELGIAFGTDVIPLLSLLYTCSKVYGEAFGTACSDLGTYISSQSVLYANNSGNGCLTSISQSCQRATESGTWSMNREGIFHFCTCCLWA